MSRVQQKTDREIHRDVLEELKWDPRVDAEPAVRNLTGVKFGTASHV